MQIYIAILVTFITLHIVTNEVLNYLLSKKRKNLNGQLSKGLRDEFARWNKEHSKPEKRYDA